MDTILVKDGKNRVTVSVAEKGATGPAGPQGQSANLIPANSTTLGGIIVGDNLSITGNGVLSAQPGGVTAFNNRTGNVSLTSSDVTTALATPFSCLTFTGTSSAYPFFFDILNSNGTESVGTFSQTDSNNRYVYTGQRIIGATVLGNGVTRTYFPSVRLVRDKTNTVNDRLEIDYSWTENATTGPVYSTTLALKENGLSLSSTSQDSSGQNYGLIVTKPYADAKYTLTACFTSLSATVTNQYILINDLDIRLTDLEPLVDLKLPTANFTFANLTGKPTTLAGYGITDGLTSANLTPYLTTASANSTYAVLGHTHSIANVTGLQTALDAKLPSANFTYANLTGKPTLANVATSGSYTDLSNTPAAYSLPTATNTTLGGIKVGANLSISNGVLSAISSGSSATSLPWANITFTPLTLAGYGITDGLTTTDAAATYVTFSEANNAFAAKTVAINPGTGLTGGGNLALSRTLSLANTTVTAGSYGSSSLVPVLAVDAQGRLTSVTTAAVSGYTLPAATTSTLGGVRLGAGVGLDANGFLTTDVKLTTNTFTGTQNLGGNLLTQPKLQAYRETSTAPTISAGSLTLDLSGSNFFAVSLNAAISTITISNIPSSSVSSFTLEFTGTGTTYSVNWTLSSGVIKWAGAASAPTITATTGKKDVFCFYTTDGGSNWLGFIGGQNY